MKIERHYTQSGVSATYDLVPLRDDQERNPQYPDGSVVFSLEGRRDSSRLEPGRGRCAGNRSSTLPAKPASQRGWKRIGEESVPSFLWRSIPGWTALEELACRKEERVGSETSKLKLEVFDRLVEPPGPIGAGRLWLFRRRRGRARLLRQGLRFMLARQMAAPNSLQWFNTGLHWAYGVDGPSQGHYYVDFESRKTRQVEVGL